MIDEQSLRAPYPGLRAFRRDETDLFFGREDCINAMVDRLAATRFLAVLGIFRDEASRRWSRPASLTRSSSA